MSSGSPARRGEARIILVAQPTREVQTQMAAPARRSVRLMDPASIYSLSYNFGMKRPRKRTSISRAQDDPLTRYAGPSETVAASVPRALTAAIRAKVGKREFSRFVGRALARELIDQNRATYVASFEKDHGSVDPQLTAGLEALFAR